MFKTKPRIILLFLSICVLLGGIKKFFVGTGIKADIFLFYDYPDGGRLVSNIINDIADSITLITIFSLWYISVPYRNIKNVVLPFLIICVVDLGDYILFYGQNSIYKLLILVGLMVLCNLKNLKLK